MCIVLYIRVTYLGREKKLFVSILCEFRCADKIGLYVQKIYWWGGARCRSDTCEKEDKGRWLGRRSFQLQHSFKSFSKVDGDSSSQPIKGVLYLIGRGCLSTPTMSVIGWEQPTRKNGLKANMMGGPAGQPLVLSVNYAPPAGDLIVVFSWPPSLV